MANEIWPTGEEEVIRLPDHLLERHQGRILQTTVFGFPVAKLDRDSLIAAMNIMREQHEMEKEMLIKNAAMEKTLLEAKLRMFCPDPGDEH